MNSERRQRIRADRSNDRPPGGSRDGAALRTSKGAGVVISDIAIWFASVALAAVGRFDFAVEHVNWPPIAVLVTLLAGVYLLVAGLLSMYGGRYLVGSFDELRGLAVSATVACVFGSITLLILGPADIPRSVAFLAWPIAVVGLAGVRYTKRLIVQAGNSPGGGSEPILILGAGWVGSVLALRMIRDPASPYRPVGFLDDDPVKRNLQLHGVRVLGPWSQLDSVAATTGAQHLVIAVNRADSAMIRRISDSADAAGIGCFVLPPLSQVGGIAQVRLSTMREVNVEDLIGRRAVDTDVLSIAEYVTGRRVLVSGAGGSIGAELCRQLHKFGPAELIMVDRDESALHAVELSIFGRALLDSPTTVLVDIRDERALREVFEAHRPEVVFHAAALKHLPLLERYPLEALKSNVYGTLNVLQASLDVRVTNFVNVSTDKAANPTSALGHSKRLAEQLTSWYAMRAGYGTRYLSVRFGNVLGSRGSVLLAFAAQIEAGGPVTVTDPEVTRYFMTIREACQLVIQAGAIGRPGEALVLDMGQPVKIVDVAQRMIDRSGANVNIAFTGLRPGEKMHEDLFGGTEAGLRPFHPMISHVSVPALAPEAVESQPWVIQARGSFGATQTMTRAAHTVNAEQLCPIPVDMGRRRRNAS